MWLDFKHDAEGAWDGVELNCQRIVNFISVYLLNKLYFIVLLNDSSFANHHLWGTVRWNRVLHQMSWAPCSGAGYGYLTWNILRHPCMRTSLVIVYSENIHVSYDLSILY
jgi:hypothetical protein